jgi:low affinity Fe/Cu permease
MHSLSDRFSRAARAVSRASGSPWAFLTALLIIIIWAVAGFIFGFTDTIQLLINTGTTIVTFLMVFLIQASQNHDTDAMNLKLDELLRAVESAQSDLARAEELNHSELKEELQARRGQGAKQGE